MTRLNNRPNELELGVLWESHTSEWRNPFEVVSQWQNIKPLDSKLLDYKTTGRWWEILDATRSTLLVTREYEHTVMALTVLDGIPIISYMQLPHPSGIAINLKKKMVHIASTRNPNLIFDFAPVSGYLSRRDLSLKPKEAEDYLTTLLPKRVRFYPGCFYIHDLALIDGKLYANSVGQNAVVYLGDDSHFERVWWPHCIENEGKPAFDRNYIQLNSIAPGIDISTSYFSASTNKISARRPGHQNFQVDRRGVIFSGRTREPVASGLTRPHSARIHNGQLFVDDSGYGQLVVVDNSEINTIACLPGWTRGLALYEKIAFVGSSRVIPRFRQYAPGLNVNESKCGIHAVDLQTGHILASLFWPYGNQIFAIELAPRNLTSGFPLRLRSKRSPEREKKLFYTFQYEKAK